MFRFQKLGEDEQARLDQESLKQKKELLRQEFEHQEEIRKYDKLSIVSSNDFKFKAELDRMESLNRKKKQELEQILRLRQNENRSKIEASQMHTSTSGYGVIRSINNHHSDPLFETFSGSINMKQLDIQSRESYIEQLLCQEERYENLILEEQEKSESLQSILIEIEKSKLIQQQKCEELQIILLKAGKRFSNTAAVKLMAENKRFLSKKNLKTIKSEFGQMKSMQDTFKHSQENKQSELQKILYVGEENIGHNVLKIEEAERLIDVQKKEFESLEEKKQNQLKKKQESRYILTYIEFFEIFEQIFMNKDHPNEIRLVDQYSVNEELLQRWSQHQQIEGHSEQEMNFDRNELLSQINRFYQNDEQRTCYILDFMLEKYWYLQQELTKKSICYEGLLKQKEILLDEIENLDFELKDLQIKNPNLDIHEQSLVAEDAGLMNIKNETTTLNIKKMEQEEQHEQVVWIKATKAQGLLMKFQLGLAEFLHRVFQIIQAIDQKNKENKKFKYAGLNNEVSNINQLIAKIYNRTKQVNSETEFAPQHLNQYAILSIFTELFSNLKEQDLQQASQYFYIQSKTDNILWFHLSVENLTNFLKAQHSSNLTKLLSPEIINSFREELIKVFIQNFHKLFDFYQTMYKKVRDIGSDLLIHLKELNPKFDTNKLTKVMLRESQDMHQAKELVIRRMMEYKTGENVILNKNDLAQLKQQNLRPKTEEEQAQQTLQSQQQQSDLSDPAILFPKRDRLDDEKLQQIQAFFKTRIREKNQEIRDQRNNESVSTKDRPNSNIEQLNSESISMIKGENKLNRAKSKKIIESKTARNPQQDDLEQERGLIKTQIAADIQRMKEEKERKEKPELKEQQNERKIQIKQATERLYGERQYTVQIMRNMAQTTSILSDINQLEHFPTKIESPQLVGQFVIQRKNLHRNLNKEIALPTLSYLKPTSAYYSRRNQSSEQIKAMDYKRYYEIENGVSARPSTQYQSSRKPQTATNLNSSRGRNNLNSDELKQKYSQRTRMTNGDVTGGGQSHIPIPQEFPSQDRPKSILVPSMQ